MCILDRPGQHDHIASVARRERKTLFGRLHIGQSVEHPAQPPDLDAQSCAMGAALGASPGQISASARANANNTGRLANEMTACVFRTAWRVASTTSASDCINNSTSSSK